MSDFKPAVKLFCNIWQTVLPRELEEKVYDILRNDRFQDHVVKLESEGPTQISARPYAGYDEQEAGKVLLVAIYCATKPLEDLLNFQSWLSLTKDIYASAIEIDSKLDFTEKDISPYVTNYVIWKTEEELRSLIKNGIKLIDEKVPYRYRREMVEAKKRLEFISPLSLTISPWEKTKRLKTCRQAIELVEKATEQALAINENIRENVDMGNRIIGNFLHFVRQNPLNKLTHFNTAKKEVSEALNVPTSKEKFDFEAVNKAYQNVMDITPSAKM
ncbi:MAG TPA: hypothetical protein PLI45_05020 [Candidatus Woesebacteria bacterium]|nr:hypothetical protein [Candidatus Woesebacteria bacterium]